MRGLDIRLLGALLVLLLLAACAPSGGPTPPPGPLVGVMKVAAKTAPADIAFDAFLSDLNLLKAYGGRADEIQAQLKASRTSVNAKVKSVRLMSYSARQGLLLVSDTDVIMPLIFASTLADALDPVTAGRTTGGQSPSAPLTSTSDGPTTTTTTFLNIITQLSGSGSKVTLTMHWTYRETTVDKATGAKLVDLSDDRTMVGTIDVCPGASGISPATIDVHIQLSASTGGGTKTRSSTSSNTFSGHVDDQAVLRRVTQDAQIQTSWQTDAGSGGYDVNLTNANWQASESGVGSGVDSNAVGGSWTSKGAATADQVTKDAGKTIAIDLAAIDPAYNQAQKLWRKGRCVVVTAPDYKAETPISVADQEKMQHDETVDKGSTTTFGANLRHRFGGGLNQPVTAKLTSGAKKLEPGQLRAVPAKLSYTAPDEADKKATVQLNSVSKRGIGTLVLGFNTGAARLKLTIKGTSKTTVSNFYVAGGATIGPVEFTKKDDTTWEGNAPFQGNFDSEPWVEGCIHMTSAETGSAYLTGTIDKSADPNVWVVRMGDGDRTYADVTVTCAAGSTKNPRDRTGATIGMLIQIGEIRIPIDGGTVPVHVSRTDGDVMYTVDATVTATIGKK